MANYLINDTQLTSVADAIRAKSGSNEGISFPNGFISEIGNISGTQGQDYTIEDALVSSSEELTIYENPRITNLRSYALTSLINLKKVKLNNCTNISEHAFSTQDNSLTTLEEIWLGSSTVAYCSGNLPRQFKNTSKDKQQGSIYVPNNLVESYRTSQAWSNYNTHIFSENDYPRLYYDTITDDINTICEKINNGTADYPLYGTKIIDLGTEGLIQFEIVGKNIDELANSSQTVSYTWLAMNILKNEHRFNPPYSSQVMNTGAYGGWENSELRYYLNNTIFQLFPVSLQNTIKEVKKYSGGYSLENERVPNILTTDKLWIPSSHEIQNSQTYESVGVQYYYSSEQITAESRKRYEPNTYIAHNYLLRSANRYDRMRMINESGTGGNAELIENNTYGILIGFCT